MKKLIQIGKDLIRSEPGRLTSVRFFSQLISMGTMPIISRLYTPAEMGPFTVFMTVYSFLSVISCFQFDNILFNLNTEDEHQAIGCGLFTGFLVAILAVIFGVTLEKFSFESFKYFSWLISIILGICVFLASIIKLRRSQHLKHQHFDIIAQMTLLSGLSSIVVRFILGLILPNYFSLIVSEVVSLMAALILLFYSSPKIRLKAPDLAGVKKILKNFSSFFTIGQLSAVIDSFGMFAPVLVFSALFGSIEAGLYGFAIRLVTIVNQNLGTSMTEFLMSSLSKSFREQRPDLISTEYRKYIRTVIFWGVPICSAIAILSPFLTEFIFGRKWSKAGLYISILSPWYLMALLVSPISNILTILHQQRFKIIYDIIAVSIPIMCYFIQKSQHYSAVTFLTFFSSLQCIAYLMYFYIINWRLNEFLKNAYTHSVSIN